MKTILGCFELVLGLKVDFHKNNLLGIGVEDGNMWKFSSLLNCKRMQLLFVYLGIPFGTNPRKEATWELIILKMRKKLAMWKQKSLSIGEGFTLIILY